MDSPPGDIVIPKVRALNKKYNGNISLMVSPKNFASKIDLSAFLHDVLYVLASDEPDKESQNKAIRAADLHLISKLEKIKASGDNNATIPLLAIKAKVKAEGIGAPVYGANEKIPTESDRILLNKIKEHLRMVGAGKKKKKYENIISIVK